MEQASDYNPLMTPLIIKYGELLLNEYGVIRVEVPDEITLQNCEHYQHENCQCLKRCELCD